MSNYNLKFFYIASKEDITNVLTPGWTLRVNIIHLTQDQKVTQPRRSKILAIRSLGLLAKLQGTVQDSTLPTRTGTDEHWKMGGFTIRSFTTLHKHIYPIVKSIIAMDKYKDHPFTVKWNRWKDFPPGYEDKNIKLILEWKNVSSHFNGNLMKYKDFIHQC